MPKKELMNQKKNKKINELEEYRTQEKDWKSLKKIRRIFKVGRNKSLAIYNLARREHITYEEAIQKLYLHEHKNL